MDIDMSALRMLEREKGIPVSVVVDAIETALLSAYHKSSGAHHAARVELDQTTGHVTVWAKERLEVEPPRPRATTDGGRDRSRGPSRSRHRPRRGSPPSSTTRPTTSDASPPPWRAS